MERNSGEPDWETKGTDMNEIIGTHGKFEREQDGR
jgi:hypothetical protein